MSLCRSIVAARAKETVETGLPFRVVRHKCVNRTATRSSVMRAKSPTKIPSLVQRGDPPAIAARSSQREPPARTPDSRPLMPRWCSATCHAVTPSGAVGDARWSCHHRLAHKGLRDCRASKKKRRHEAGVKLLRQVSYRQETYRAVHPL